MTDAAARDCGGVRDEHGERDAADSDGARALCGRQRHRRARAEPAGWSSVPATTGSAWKLAPVGVSEAPPDGDGDGARRWGRRSVEGLRSPSGVSDRPVSRSSDGVADPAPSAGRYAGASAGVDAGGEHASHPGHGQPRGRPGRERRRRGRPATGLACGSAKRQLQTRPAQQEPARRARGRHRRIRTSSVHLRRGHSAAYRDVVDVRMPQRIAAGAPRRVAGEGVRLAGLRAARTGTARRPRSSARSFVTVRPDEGFDRQRGGLGQRQDRRQVVGRAQQLDLQRGVALGGQAGDADGVEVAQRRGGTKLPARGRRPRSRRPTPPDSRVPAELICGRHSRFSARSSSVAVTRRPLGHVPSHGPQRDGRLQPAVGQLGLRRRRGRGPGPESGRCRLGSGAAAGGRARGRAGLGGVGASGSCRAVEAPGRPMSWLPCADRDGSD